MRAIVALELNGLTPGFDQVVDAGDLQRLSAFLALKQAFPRVIGGRLKQVSDGLDTSPVQGEQPWFAGFLFVDLNRTAGLKVSDLINPKPKQIRGS